MIHPPTDKWTGFPTLAELRSLPLSNYHRAKMEKAVAKAIKLSQKDGRLRFVISTGPSATKVTLRRPIDVDTIVTNGTDTYTWHVGKSHAENYIQW